MSEIDIGSKKVLEIGIEGLNPEIWNQLHKQFCKLLEETVTSISDDGKNKQLAKNIGELAMTFAKAKIQKPTLENEKLKAEIAHEYALANKVATEDEKLKEEIIEQRLNNIEKLLTIISQVNGAALSVVNQQDKFYLFVGEKPRNEEND